MRHSSKSSLVVSAVESVSSWIPLYIFWKDKVFLKNSGYPTPTISERAELVSPSSRWDASHSCFGEMPGTKPDGKTPRNPVTSGNPSPFTFSTSPTSSERGTKGGNLATSLQLPTPEAAPLPITAAASEDPNQRG